MNPSEIIAAVSKFIVPTYVRPAVVFTHGAGVYVFDADGNRYLDFAAGIAVNALGHADAEWVAAVSQQAGRLTHVSNLYHTEPHVALAQRLVEHSFAERVFLCNSGTEANEAALKFARKYSRVRQPGQSKTRIVAFTNGFHGRTLGALSVTEKEAYRTPFEPLPPDVVFAEFNDLDSAGAVIDATVCAVIVEPVQGEGGVHPATAEFLRGLRALCDDVGALLIFDEIQCGLGRTGHLWAHEHVGVTPDILTLAKPLAGGLPIGATLTTEAVASVMEPGDHGSTFAAGPLVCRAAQVVFDRVSAPGFLDNVRANGEYLLHRLRTLESDAILEVRGAGLLVGVEFARPVADLIARCRARGLLLIGAGEHVLRLCPPLIVNRAHIDEAVGVIEGCLEAGG